MKNKNKARYRIFSHTFLKNPKRHILTIEELGKKELIRCRAQLICRDTEMMEGFSEQEANIIKFAVYFNNSF